MKIRPDRLPVDVDVPLIRVVSERRQVAKKGHQCEYCKLTITLGETYLRVAYVGEESNVLGVIKSHLRCEEEP